MRGSTIKTISMYPEQWAIVEQVNARYRFNSVSAAIRFIISEWAKNQEPDSKQCPEERGDHEQQ